MKKTILTIAASLALVAPIAVSKSVHADPPYDYLPPCTLSVYLPYTIPVTFFCEPYTIPGTTITLNAIAIEHP